MNSMDQLFPVIPALFIINQSLYISPAGGYFVIFIIN